jgi:hypothetical protein
MALKIHNFLDLIPKILNQVTTSTEYRIRMTSVPPHVFVGTCIYEVSKFARSRIVDPPKYYNNLSAISTRTLQVSPEFRKVSLATAAG